MKRVAIIGGGVAGLSAAQELLSRGFAVDVYELNAIPGGKARSFDVPADVYKAEEELQPLPAEHGFRFFPGFYKHLVDSMRGIPFPGKDSVADNLLNIDFLNYARFGKDVASVPVGKPRSWSDVVKLFKLWVSKNGIDMPIKDLLMYSWRIFRFFSSCDRRVHKQYEEMDWWHFIRANKGSEAYRRYFANGSRILVAADPRKASAKTSGMIMEQLIIDQATGEADRILSGPTNNAWLFPWLRSLVENPHCRFFVNARIVDIVADESSSKVTSLKVEHRGESAVFSRVSGCDLETGPLRESVDLPEVVEADYYLSAVPVEVMAGFVGDENNWSVLSKIDEGLKKISELKHHTQWMNGVVFYLKGDLSTLSGHAVYVDTPFALSSIFQGRYWDDQYDLTRYGRGNLTGILSTIISNWKDTENCNDDSICPIPNGGRGRIYNQSALDTISYEADFEMGKEKLIQELWNDLKDSLSIDGAPLLSDENFEFAYIDPGIRVENGEVRNAEPLLVNRKNGWRLRPVAETQIENFFLAGDYVQTHTDLATMEGACEAAKRAVNAILVRDGSASPPCDIYPLKRIAWFAPLRFIDSILYRLFPG